MVSLIEEFGNELIVKKYLIVMPISRFKIYHNFNIGHFKFYPANIINLNELRIVPNDTFEQFEPMKFLNLRELQSSVTGISIEVLQENILVAFPVQIDWPRFLSGDHLYYLTLIHKFSAEAEELMDLIRFNYCRMDLPNTLPGRVGTWEGSNGFSGALLYALEDNAGYLIGGSDITHSVIAGIGLEIDGNDDLLNEQFTLINGTGEVGSIARTALSLFSAVLESNTPTNKFIQAMILLDFMGNPYSYSNIKDFKKDIICHIAQSKNDYHRLSNRFKELTGKKDSAGNEIGYRTLIVHLGKRLESIIEDQSAMADLFLELQSYLGSNIKSLIDNSCQTWDNFMQYKAELRHNLGID